MVVTRNVKFDEVAFEIRIIKRLCLVILFQEKRATEQASLELQDDVGESSTFESASLSE